MNFYLNICYHLFYIVIVHTVYNTHIQQRINFGGRLYSMRQKMYSYDPVFVSQYVSKRNILIEKKQEAEANILIRIYEYYDIYQHLNRHRTNVCPCQSNVEEQICDESLNKKRKPDSFYKPLLPKKIYTNIYSSFMQKSVIISGDN